MQRFTTALTTLASLAAVAAPTTAQAVTFTGDVQADFPAQTLFADPGGIDVGVPTVLTGSISGWDIDNVAISYDVMSDTLFVGFDTFGITGDADGDGDPGGTSAALAGAGGADSADLSDTEAATFALDLDDDGNLDIIAGIPFGADITGFTVADFQGTIFSPSLSFGAPRPLNVGAVFASPSAAAPDLEFTIVNFSMLVEEFAQPGQLVIGVNAFLGSFQDAGIGEDFIPGTEILDVPVDAFPCLPIENVYQLISITPDPATGGQQVRTGYGLKPNYGCCALISPTLDAVGVTISALPGMPILNVGKADGSDLCVVDLGIPIPTGSGVACKETLWTLTAGTPAGMTYYAQTIAYPGPLAVTQEWFISNVITVVAP